MSDKLRSIMKTIAIYPGSFDPITNGHIDLIHRACKLFDEIIIAITQNASKTSLLSIDQRIEAVEASITSISNTRVLGFNSLLVDFAREHNAQIIIRGLRAVSDFEYEFQLAGMNKQLNNKIETVFLMSDPENQVISSKFVKEIAKLKGKIKNFVTKSTEKKIKEKYD